MGSSRFVPLVIAGFIGLLVGWLLGPDVDDVEDALGERLTQIEAKVDAVQAPLGALQTGFKGVDERITQIATQVQAVGTPTDAVTALSAKLDQANAATKAATDALSQKLDAIASAPAPAAPAGGGEFAALASGLGNSGAILLAGQSAIFGSKTLTVASVADGKASLAPQGGTPSDVASGASVDLGEGCSVTLKGVAGPAALLAPTGCGAPAAAASGAAAAPAAAPAAASAPAAPAPAPAPAPAAASAPAPAAAAAAAPAAGNGALAIGQTAVFGEKKAFLSRIDAGAQTAHFFIPGKGQVPGKAGEAVDLGDGCSLTVASVEATSVAVQPTGCGEAPAGAASAAAAPAAAPAEAAPAPAPAAPATAAPAATPATAPAAPAEPAAAPAAAPTGAAGAGAPIGVGQTATFGEKRIFLSRLTPEAAYIVVIGSGPQEVKVGASADLTGGCTAKLDKIETNTASFTPAGC